MGEFDRPEWIPSEEELRAELCNAREIDWPAEASKYINYRDEWLLNTSCDYDEYMRGLSRDGRNFPEIPLRYMGSPADWRDRPLDFILNQIWSSPEEYQGYIMEMVNRYLTACFKRLDGKWPSDIWDGSGNPFFTRNCYTFCCPEWVGDDDLLRKIIVLQKLQSMLSRDDSVSSEPAEQTGEPEASDGATVGRVYRPKQDIIDLIESGNGTFRGWKPKAQEEIDTIQKKAGSGSEQLDKKTACDIFYRAYEPQFGEHKRTSGQVYDALRKSPRRK